MEHTPKEEEIREEFRKFCNHDNFSAPPYETDTIADYWLKIRREAIADRDAEILTKISQYRCHPDEIHCTCMDALKNWLEGKEE